MIVIRFEVSQSRNISMQKKDALLKYPFLKLENIIPHFKTEANKIHLLFRFTYLHSKLTIIQLNVRQNKFETAVVICEIIIGVYILFPRDLKPW